MKNILKKLIIILVIVTMALIVSIIILQGSLHDEIGINENKNIISTGQDETPTKQEDAPQLTLSEDIKKAQTESIFYIMKQCINKYYNAIEKQDSSQVYNLLSTQYIRDKNVTISNVFNVIGTLKNGFEDFRVRKVYYRELDLTGKYEYYILGDILTEDYSSLNSVYIIVNVDNANNTFSITPSNSNIENDTQYYQILEELSDKDTNNSYSINLNEYNKYNSKSLETKEILQFYLDDYTTMALNYPETAYHILDEEYREKRFGSLEEYKNHIAKNTSKLETVIPIKYGFTQKDSNRQYTVIDNYNNTYVIKIADAMEYSIIADMYTVNLDSVIEKYDEGSDENKVQINIQKIVEALNNKDYEYVYSKLSDDFKTNKYPTIESLKNDIALYGSCYVVFGESSSEGENYIYDIEIKGSSASSSNLKMNITMQLKEERDFTFEFEIQQEQYNS